jgi:ELWxxDGT repeat protein
VGSFPVEIATSNGTVFFAADDRAHGQELWKTDGTAAGTAMLKDIQTVPAGSDPSQMTGLNGTVYFAASDIESGEELWRSDGTAAGTVRVADLNPGAAGSDPRHLTPLGDTLYFVTTGTPDGYGLWRTDGTAAGTVRLAATSTTPWGFPSLAAVGDTLYFSGHDPSGGAELWRTDGTAAGTVRVKDIVPGPAGSDPLELTPVGNRLFFTADTPSGGRELWRSDGTAAGTVRVSDIYPGFTGSNPRDLTAVGTRLYFVATHYDSGEELWRSDGSAAGTVLVKDINPGSHPSNPYWLTAIGTTLFFSAFDPEGGAELWKSDGTAAGTVRVKDMVPGDGGSSPHFLTPVGDTLYFSAEDTDGGRELWKSDGTAAGTVRVTDIANAYDMGVSRLTNVNGSLYFTTLDSKLWRIDGTALGAVRVAYSDPHSDLALVDGTLYFANGELWKLDLTAPPAATVVGRHVFYNNSSFDGRDPAASATDDAAVATDKAALLPGQSPSFANLTGYTRGLNGVMLDVTGLPPDAILTADDFTFRAGRTADPASLAAGPVPASVTVRRGAGIGGSDRVTLTWLDHGRAGHSGGSQAVANGWLEVTVKATANTGLAAPDVFSFGNLVGETGDRPDRAVVTTTDFVRTRENFTRSAGVTNRFDHDRDGRVSGTDLAAVRPNMRVERAPFRPTRDSVAARILGTSETTDVLTNR